MLSTEALVGALLLSTAHLGLADSEYCKAPIDHPGEAFSYVQPLNTTILTPYGSSPPVYPSPNTTGNGGWEASVIKAKEWVAKLTLDEKSWMATGQPGPCVGNLLPIPRVNFTGLCLQNGPQCVQQGDYSSVFISSVSAAASWDRKLLYDRAYALATEHKAKGSHVILGPIGGPLGRSPYDGRTWEGFAADPYLTGVCMEITINGMQDAGVQANAKHFIANEQETQRNPTYDPEAAATTYIQDSVSANIDDRTLHEIYMWPFANAIRSKVASVMCSYNRLNGSHACQNSYLLNHLLKQELGFQGYVMSDWGATHSGVASVQAGMDMTMPGGFTTYGELWDKGSWLGQNLTFAIQNGTVSLDRLDDMIVRIMTPYFLLGQDKDYPSVDASVGPLNVDSPPDKWLYDWTFTSTTNRDVRANHSTLIREHGASSIVLLKNENNALPLSKPKSMILAGNAAGPLTQGPFLQGDFEYGVLAGSASSGSCRFSYIVTPLDAINARARQDGTLIQSYLNNTFITTANLTYPILIPQEPDVCLVFLKAYFAEGHDRTSLDLDWDANAVVEAIAGICNNTVVITESGGVNVMPFADHENVTAILAVHYAGQEVGNAIADVLYGDVNPSGHLPYVIAYNESDYNAPLTTAVQNNNTYEWQSWFDEGLEVGYRYFDAHNISVRYEFGHGLSYTTFQLKDLKSKQTVESLTALPSYKATQPGGNPELWETIYTLEAEVSNTGDVDGYAVPQLYVQFPTSTPAGTPPSQLRGFDKIWLTAGEKKIVTFELMRRDVSYWDVTAQDWRIPTGPFTFKAGFSSRDFRTTKVKTVIKA